jgi:multidrug transporter EmrE-like cation transporter
MTFGFSIFLAVLAYTLLSSGFVLMKKGISWIGYKGKKDRKYYKNIFTWVTGFVIMNSYIVPNAVALKYLEPHIVSAFAGWGVVVLVFLSHSVLKESLFKSDFIFSLVIFISIISLNIFELKNDRDIVKLSYLISASLLPLFIIIPAFLKPVSKRLKTILFAGVSGISTGMIIVSIKTLVTFSGFNISRYLTSPYLYLYLFFSISAFITLQVSYKMGRMMLVGPVQYSASIIYPVLCSYFVFGNNLRLIQIASILILIYGTAGILKKH